MAKYYGLSKTTYDTIRRRVNAYNRAAGTKINPDVIARDRANTTSASELGKTGGLLAYGTGRGKSFSIAVASDILRRFDGLINASPKLQDYRNQYIDDEITLSELREKLERAADRLHEFAKSAASRRSFSYSELDGE